MVGFPFGVKPIAIRAQCVYPHRDAQSFGPSCERAGISRPLRKTGGRSCATMGEMCIRDSPGVALLYGFTARAYAFTLAPRNTRPVVAMGSKPVICVSW